MTDIILKQGTGVPSDSDLEVAEVAIDSSSGAMYTKLADGSVKHLNPEGGSASGGLSGGWEYSNSASAGKFTSRNQDWYTATTFSFHNTDAVGGKHTLALVSEGDVIVLGSEDGLRGAEYRVLSVAPNLDVYTFTVEPISFFGQFFSDGEMVNADFVPQLGEESLWEQNGNDIYYSDGNVGIGTSDPDVDLHIYKSNPIIKMEHVGNNSSRFYFESTTDGAWGCIQASNESGNRRLLFAPNNGTGDARYGGLTLHTDKAEIGGEFATNYGLNVHGKVGIGDNNPSHFLAINNTDGGSPARTGTKFAQSSWTGNYGEIVLDTLGSSSNFDINAAGSSNFITFSTDGTTRAVVNADGTISVTNSNAGTNPAANSNIAGELRFFNESATNNNLNGIGFYNSNNSVDARIVGIHKDHASRHGEIAFLTHNGSNLVERMRIDEEGRVGIGGDPSRSTKEIEEEAVATLADWKAQIDDRLKAEPKADKKAVTLEITGEDKLPTKAELIKSLTKMAIGGGTAKLQVAGDGFFSGNIATDSGRIVRPSLNAGIAFSQNGIYPADGSGNLLSGAPTMDIGGPTDQFKNGYFSGDVKVKKLNASFLDVNTGMEFGDIATFHTGSLGPAIVNIQGTNNQSQAVLNLKQGAATCGSFSAATNTGNIYIQSLSPAGGDTIFSSKDTSETLRIDTLGNATFAGTVSNVNGPLVSTASLIETLSTLRNATKDETTLEGLRDAIGNAVGGLIEKFEAMQEVATQEIEQ